MEFDFQRNPYPSRRSPVLAPNGMVATGQPLAAQAGLSMLQQGGTAVDAAIATAVALTVLEPTMNGIGGDAFALIWDGTRVHGINGSGRAPAATSIQSIRAARLGAIPKHGWWPVTVPGAPRAWADLHERFGRLPFATLFEPAIAYAEKGYPVSPLVAGSWYEAVHQTFARHAMEPAFRPWFATFAPGGTAPRAGERWSSEPHAQTLRRIAASSARDFYAGDIARAIASFSRESGGTLDESDLAAHTSSWVMPISSSYRDAEVWEIPPNGQGIMVLVALNILAGLLNPGQHARDSVASYHLQIEALKLAFVDAGAYVADPDHVQVPVQGLLSQAYAEQRRGLVGERAAQPAVGKPGGSSTVYLCAADSDGMMVSFIQSNYMGFGSGIVIPGTGIALHNRGFDFQLDEAHPNRLQPGKRPYHTIIPGFLTRDGQAVGPFGVMGGYMQAQGHVQMMVNTLDYAMQPQASLDAPRWRFEGGRHISLEEGTSAEVIDGLRALGHDITIVPSSVYFGRGQIIWRTATGYAAGSEKRADGAAVGY